MRILLVEDNEKISELIVNGLQKRNFSVDPVFNSDEAMSALGTSQFNVVILDLGLPDEDGIDILKSLRDRNNPVPVLILTARDSLDQKIYGLNSGADDYLTKPFEMDELEARLHALLRRPADRNIHKLELSNIVLDPLNKQTEIDGKPVKLSKKEVVLLEILLRSKERIVQKDNLEMQLYSYEDKGSINSVEVLLHRLRKKIESEGAKVEIYTLRGIGYMIKEKPDEKITT